MENDKVNEVAEVEVEKDVVEENTMVDNIETDELNSTRRNLENKEKKSVNKKILRTIITLSIIVLSIIGFFAVNKLNTTKVYKNVYLNDVEMSSKTETEVRKYVEDMSVGLKERQIHILNGKKEIGIIKAEDIDLKLDVNTTVSKVMKFGRDKSIIFDNFNIFKALFNKQNIDVEYSYSTAKIKVYISEIMSDIEGAVINDEYTIDESTNTLVIITGKSGKGVEEVSFENDILNLLKKSDDKEATYTVKLEDRKPTKLDVDYVYSQVKRDPVDAKVDQSSGKPVFTNHVVGLDFDKTELKSVLEKTENLTEGKTIKFELKVTQPKIKLSDIKWDLYDDKVAGYTTYFTTWDSNRVTNLRRGLRKLEGTVVMPGETFSFNKTLGSCSSAQGFLPASTFKNGEHVKEVGGGICQIASTLYNAALYANLEIVSRKNHSLPVGYVPAGRDATVYYPYLDFKFKNNRTYPLKIVTSFNAGGSMTINLMGTKEDVEYEVILTSWKTGTIASTTRYQDDSTLDKGKTKVIYQGTNGYTSIAYKEVRLNI